MYNQNPDRNDIEELDFDIHQSRSLFNPEDLPGHGDPEEAFENMLHGKALLADFDAKCKEWKQ